MTPRLAWAAMATKQEQGLVLNNELGAIEVPSDGLADKYAAMAEDRSSKGKKKEAAKAFSDAERLLNQDVDHDKVIKLAREALEGFKKAGESDSVADSLRLVVHGLRAKAELLRFHGKSPRDVLKEAEKFANENLELAEEKKDKRMQASMLLSFAEVNRNKRGKQKRELALESVQRAVPIFEELKLGNLQAMALLILSRIWYKKQDLTKCTNFADDAANLYSELGDRKGEAVAWHAVGTAQWQASDYRGALASSDKALALLEEVDDKKMLASETHSRAVWLMDYDPAKALLPAKDAYSMFKELEYGRGWEASSLSLIAEGYCACNEPSKAVRAAKLGVKNLEKRGDKAEAVRAMHALMRAYTFNDDGEEAVEVAEKGIVLAQELGDRNLEVTMLRELTKVFTTMSKMDDALDAAHREKALLNQMGDTKDELVAQMHNITKVHLKEGDRDKSMRSAEMALKMVENIKDKRMEAYALLASAGVHAFNDDNSQALKLAQEASDLFHEEQDKPGEAKALTFVTRLYKQNEEYRAALRSAKDVLELHDQMRNTRGQAVALQEMAEIYVEDSKSKEALPLVTDGIRRAKEADDDKLTAQMMTTMVQVYVGMAESMQKGTHKFEEYAKKALQTAKDAVSRASKINDMSTEGDTQYWLGYAYDLTDKVQDALQAASEASSLYRQSGNLPGQAKSMALLGKAWMAKGNLAKAQKWLEDAAEKAKQAGDVQVEKMVQDLLKEATPKAAPQAVDPALLAAMQAQAAAGPAAPAAQAAATAAAASPAPVAAYQPPDMELVKTRVKQMVVEMTGSDDLEADVPFMDAGVDSLASVELRTTLQSGFGVPLPSTVLFNYPRDRKSVV